MRLSAELRWFWRGEPTTQFERWFIEATLGWPAARPAKTRLDEYLANQGQTELGIKKRSGGSLVEIKGLIAERQQALAFAHCTANIELWVKWASSTFDLFGARLIKVEKRRRMRSFRPNGTGIRELPPSSEDLGMDTASGCNVELTRITGPDQSSWWTVGFEAFGALDEIEDLLAGTLSEMNSRNPLPPTTGQACSYPVWLATQGW